VDDNVDSADSLAMLLTMTGHEARTAHSGAEALETARDYLPRVVLLDIGLPQMDGYEVARQLRRRPELAGVVLLAMTGYGQEEDRRRSREAGFDHHLVKPVDPNELQDLLRRLPVVRDEASG
jgi:CheY-like chemotaxis protein